MESLTMAVLLLSLLGLHLVASKSVGEILAEPKKCTVPQKSEGKFKINVTVVTPAGVSMNAVGVGSVHVDGTKARAAISETIHAQGQATKVNIIMVPAEKGNTTTAYLALPDLQKCLINQINTPIIPGTLPKNTTLKIRDGILEGVPVQIWDAEINEGPTINEGTMRGHAKIYLKRDRCMPMRVHLNMTVTGMRMTGTEYFDAMWEGVKDESVFDIPEYCEVKQEDVKQEDVKQEDVKQGGDVDEGVSGVDVDHDRHLEHATARLRVRRHLLF